MTSSSTRHLVDPDLLAALDAMPALRFDHDTLPALRDARSALYAATEEVPGVRVREEQVPGPDGEPDVRVLVYAPEDQARTDALPAILHIHGGGYVIGAPEMSDLANKHLAMGLRCVIVSVDYRLAPETPHPGPVEDCYAALRWLFASAKPLGIDRARISIKGESAGGGLAAALALLARDRDEVPVSHQHLTYPMLDDREPAARHDYVGEYVWTAESNRFGWQSLLGHEPGIDGVSPYAAAARAEDLEGLPAAFIATGALDLFLEENLEYARRLTRAGVPVELHVYPGAFHGFQMAPDAPVSLQYAADSERALRAAQR